MTFFLGLIIGNHFTKTSNSPQTIEVAKIEKEKCPAPIMNVENTNEKIEQAFLLFLASIGVNQSEKINAQVKQIVANPSEYKIEEMPEVNTMEEDQKSTEKTEVIFDQETFINETRTVFSSDMLPVDTLHRAFDKYLDEKKFSEYIFKSKLIESPKQLSSLNGQFVGQFYRLKGKYQGKIEEVNLVVNFQFDDRKKNIEGDFQMTLIRDDQEYSRSKGMGSNNDIFFNADDSGSVVIKAAPYIYFHFSDFKLRQANVYENNLFVGIAILNRLD